MRYGFTQIFMVICIKLAGWIKIGGVVLLGIGFSLGARGLYARKGMLTLS